MTNKNLWKEGQFVSLQDLASYTHIILRVSVTLPQGVTSKMWHYYLKTDLIFWDVSFDLIWMTKIHGKETWWDMDL